VLKVSLWLFLFLGVGLPGTGLIYFVVAGVDGLLLRQAALRALEPHQLLAAQHGG